MKSIVQIDYDFFHANNSNLQKKHTTSNSKHDEKKANGNDDFKYTWDVK
jgi:hypothetical protein